LFNKIGQCKIVYASVVSFVNQFLKQIIEISGPHGDEDIDCGILGCEAV
jgi:hypothetical protein